MIIFPPNSLGGFFCETQFLQVEDAVKTVSRTNPESKAIRDL